mmetsp:Transcript_74003/g.207725  ORF Transcript_74003/g.207725 Transcript_74003/m.207725 type:complete len:228 (-) Transcript_74003:396-1079(-)
MHAAHKLVPGDEPVALGVHVAQELHQVLRRGLPLLTLLPYHHVPVPLAQLDRAVDEDAVHDVEDGEQVDEDVERDEGAVDVPRRLDQVCDLAPIAAARHGLEQRVHREKDGAIHVRDLGPLCHCQVVHRAQIGGRALGEDQGEAVGQGEQDAEQPHERAEGVPDHVRHHAQLGQEPHGSDNAHDAPDADKLEGLRYESARAQARHRAQQGEGDVHPGDEDEDHVHRE